MTKYYTPVFCCVRPPQNHRPHWPPTCVVSIVGFHGRVAIVRVYQSSMCSIFPGPNIEYLGLCLQWWDFHLKGVENQVPDIPKFQVYVKHSVDPEPGLKFQPGTWIALDQWPHPSVTELQLVPSTDSDMGHTLLCPNDVYFAASSTGVPNSMKGVDIPYSSTTGQSCWEWLSFGQADGAKNQSLDEKYSTCWISLMLEKDLPILGAPMFRCKLKVSHGGAANIVARLVDIRPNGKWTLVTHGVFNLSHHDGHSPDKVRKLEGEVEYDVSIPLHHTGYILPQGHQLGLCVSPGFWPLVWPAPNPITLTVFVGESSFTSLTLPVVQQLPSLPSKTSLTCSDPTVGPAMPVHWERPPELYITQTDLNMYDHNKRSVSSDQGRYTLVHENITVDTRTVETYSIKEDLPTTAEAVCDKYINITFPESGDRAPLDVEVKTHSVMKGDATTFYLTNHLRVCLDGVEVYNKLWEDTVARNMV